MLPSSATSAEPLLPREVAPRGASMHRVIFNIVNCTFGTGFFLYPKQFVQNGILNSLALMLPLVALATFSLHALNLAASLSPASLKAYPETIAFFTAPWCAKLTITLYLIGAGAAYLGLVADQCTALGLSASRPVLLLIPIIVAIPFSLLRSISSFAFTSAFGVVVNFGVVLVLSKGALAKLCEHGIASQAMPEMTSTAGTPHFLTLSTLATTVTFSYQCHSDAFIPSLRSLDQPTRERGERVIFWSYSFVTVLYVVFGILGALAWGSGATADPLRDNLQNDGLTSVCRFCVVLKVLVSYPLLFFAARLCVGQGLVGEDITQPSFWPLYHGVTPVFLGATWVLAASLEEIDAIADLAAALGGTIQIFVWPGVLWIAIKYFLVHEHKVKVAQPSRRGHIGHLLVGFLLILSGIGIAACGARGVVLTEM